MPIGKKLDHADTCQKLYVYIPCDKINLLWLKSFAMAQFKKGCFETGLVPGHEELKPLYDPSSRFAGIGEGAR